MADEEPIETTLAILRECFVYKIPPRQTAGGYKAQDWNVESFLWTGRVRVVGFGDKCIIKLEDKTSGDLFAQCPVTDGAVESVTDSSRYFVLKIEDEKGRRAFVGMGFTERSDAFDFNAALLDHKRHVREEVESGEAMKRLEEADKKDYSLKDGQTIRVNVNIKRKDGSTAASKPALSGGGGFGLLPPPPSGSGVSRGSGGFAASPAAASPVGGASKDPFGDFSDFASALPSSGATSSSSHSNQFDWSGFQ